jgi:hypothetical protein
VWSELRGYAADVNLPGMLNGYNEWDFWLRFYKAGFVHGLVEEPVVYYRMHEQQLHRATIARHDEAVALIYAKHPELTSTEEKS